MLAKRNMEYSHVLEHRAYEERNRYRADCAKIIDLREDGPLKLLEDYLYLLINPSFKIDLSVEEPEGGDPKGKNREPKIDALYLCPLVIENYDRLNKDDRKTYYPLLSFLSKLRFRENFSTRINVHHDFPCDIGLKYIATKVCHVPSLNGMDLAFMQVQSDDGEEKVATNMSACYLTGKVETASLADIASCANILPDDEESKEDFDNEQDDQLFEKYGIDFNKNSEPLCYIDVSMKKTNVSPERSREELIKDLIYPFVVGQLIKMGHYPVIAYYIRDVSSFLARYGNAITLRFKFWELEGFTSIDDYNDDTVRLMLAAMLDTKLPDNDPVETEDSVYYLWDRFFRVLVESSDDVTVEVQVSGNFFGTEHYEVLNNPFLGTTQELPEGLNVGDPNSLFPILYPRKKIYDIQAMAEKQVEGVNTGFECVQCFYCI